MSHMDIDALFFVHIQEFAIFQKVAAKLNIYIYIYIYTKTTRIL